MVSVRGAGWAAVISMGCATGGTGPQVGDPTATEGGCAGGEVADGDRCVPAGCGVGPWGSVAGDVWVDAAAADGGDGSPDRPFQTIQEGADAAGALGGGTVAVAEGTYPGTLALTADHRDVEVVGRCSELVRVDATGSRDDYPGVALEGSRNTKAAIAGLTIEGATLIGVGVLHGQLDLADCVIRDVGYVGLYVQGEAAGATVSNLRIEDPRTLDGYASGFGIEVRAGATLEASGVTVVRATTAALYVHEDSELTLSDSTLSETLPEPGNGGGFGRAVLVKDGSRATLSNVAVEGSVGFGLAATGVGTQISVDGVGVTGVTAGADGLSSGVAAGEGARIDGSGLTVDNVEGVGLSAVGGTIVLDDVTVAAIWGLAKEAPGTGLYAADDGAITLDGASITGCAAAGVWSDIGGTVTLRDARIAETSLDNGFLGHSVIAFEGGQIAVSDSTILSGPGAPVVSDGDGSMVALERVDVTCAVAPWPGVPVGLAAELGGTLALTDVTMTGGTGTGIQVNGGVLTVDGVTVSGVQQLDGDFGFGLSVVLGGRVTGSDLVIRDVYGAGVNVSDSVLDLDGLDIQDVHGNVDSRGLDAENADVHLTDTWIHDMDGFGAIVSGGSFRAESLVVSDLGRPTGTSATVGLVLQSEAVGELDGASVTGVAGPGIQVYRAALTCVDCTAQDNRFAGLVVMDGSATMSGGELSGNAPDAELGGGIGVYASRSDQPTTVLLDGTMVGPHAYAGVWADGADVSAIDADLSGGPGVDLGLPAPVQGNAVYVGDAGSVELSGGSVHDGAIAVLLDDATGSFAGVSWYGNVVDIQQQRCGRALGVDANSAPEVVVCPDHDTVTIPIAYFLNFVDPVASEEGG